MRTDLEEKGRLAKAASRKLPKLPQDGKNKALLACADALERKAGDILAANGLDLDKARANGMSPALLDRLALTEERIASMAEGLRQVASLDDPVGEVTGMKKRPNGLLIGRKRVPLGVVGMIYEARPNVTCDAFALCFKTGNAVILKGGSDAINSNIAIVKVLREVLEEQGIDENAVQLIEDTSREAASEFMQMRGYLDVLIPRGGAGLIKAVVENSKVPVIETGTGNCHVFVDESADIDMARRIIINAKTQRIGVCNACESLVIHERIAPEILPLIGEDLGSRGVEIRGDARCRTLIKDAVPASEDDWGREYLDLIISVKTVSGIDEAIEHINRYSTGHSETIVTEDYGNAQRFLDEIDSAAVYVNASTRFTDGFEFGYGAEIGISTQKLHARGPMGLEALTTTKYVIYGNGQVRP
ncbi:MAG: glutamate-5-semialdehyde dehydrogenase [Firmicutes bacterium]|nr:glutamate-5-semialdehyde dehydrogenase [Bacillota bacterium]